MATTMRLGALAVFGALGLLAPACGTSGAGAQPVEVLQNGTFDDGAAGWIVWSRGAIPLPGSVVEGALELEPSGEVPSPEDQGVGQAGPRLEHGAWYELTFRATGDGVTELTSAVRSTADPRKAYAPPRT